MPNSFRSPIVTKVAGEDLSANQYQPVYLHTDGTVKATAASDTILVYGIQQNKPTIGLSVEIYVVGSGLQSLIKIYDTTAAGTALMSSVNGPITATGTGKIAFGIVTEAKDVNNIGSAVLTGNYRLA